MFVLTFSHTSMWYLCFIFLPTQDKTKVSNARIFLYIKTWWKTFLSFEDFLANSVYSEKIGLPSSHKKYVSAYALSQRRKSKIQSYLTWEENEPTKQPFLNLSKFFWKWSCHMRILSEQKVLFVKYKQRGKNHQLGVSSLGTVRVSAR